MSGVNSAAAPFSRPGNRGRRLVVTVLLQPLRTTSSRMKVMATSGQLFLKEDRTPDQIITTDFDLESEDTFPESAARYAGGGRGSRAAGRAVAMAHPNPISSHAARSGIRSRREAVVRAASINGGGRRACSVTSRRCTSIGMKATRSPADRLRQGYGGSRSGHYVDKNCCASRLMSVSSDSPASANVDASGCHASL